MVEYIPIEHFQVTDDDHSTSRIRDMPYGKQREALTIYPSELIFRNMVVDKVSPSETLLLTNVGYDHVPIQDIIVVGDFDYNGPYITGIQIGETIALHVAFHPTLEGSRTGGLYITAPNAVGTKFAALTGFGVLTEDNLMRYPLLEAGKITGDPINIANGVYTFTVSGTFTGATAQLQWRVDSSGSWFDIPNTKLTIANTIHGIPLNTGQARVLITSAGSTTSLTVILMW